MLKPSGSTPMAKTSAPSSHSASRRDLVGRAVGAVDDDAQALEGHVPRQRALGELDVAGAHVVDAAGAAEIGRLASSLREMSLSISSSIALSISSDSL